MFPALHFYPFSLKFGQFPRQLGCKAAPSRSCGLCFGNPPLYEEEMIWNLGQKTPNYA